MLKALKQFFAPSSLETLSHELYVKLVAQSRQPALYREYGVPDTVDGRFDLIALHLFMVVDGLRSDGSPEALECSRQLTEVFVSDMDRSLREMGSTDTGTGMRVKNMAQAFYGRQQAYTEGFENGTLGAALERNLYRKAAPTPEALQKMENYTRQNVAALRAKSPVSGILDFVEA